MARHSDQLHEYLPTATDFTDIRVLPQGRPNQVLCPLCKGHGMWNLKVDAYGKGRHFQRGCRQCNSWGWVDAGSLDATCIHEVEEVSRPANHRSGIHVEVCKKCGRKSSYDTSD